MEAISAWFSYNPNKRKASDVKPSTLSTNAKQCLLSLGWQFWYKQKAGGRELRYTSPEGIVYYSLKQACKACIEGGEQLYSSAKMGRGKDIKKLMELRASKKRKRDKCRVLRCRKRVRQCENSPNSCNRNTGTMFSLLIDSNIVMPGSKVSYFINNNYLPILEGLITRDGIECTCCEEVFTISGFQEHAFVKTENNPAASIFLDDGRSLLDCQVQLSKKIEAESQIQSPESKDRNDENDDICQICQYGGELVLCDGCPSAFHNSCIGLNNVPDGDWFCPSCRCGFCCGQTRADDDGVLICKQCELKYHIQCLKTTGSLRNYPTTNWFCSSGCQRVFLGLQMLVGRKISLAVDGIKWILVKNDNDLDVEKSTENYTKLKLAVELLHECFEPAEDPRTGTDIVENVIFNKGSKRFKGFYTVILEEEDEVISAANVRVHGQKVAEIPLVATRFRHRRSGMCRLLMNELERQLSTLGVQKLILPAALCVLDTWTNRFGFSLMRQSERLQLLDHAFLDFQETVMCQKLLARISECQGSSPQSEVLDE